MLNDLIKMKQFEELYDMDKEFKRIVMKAMYNNKDYNVIDLQLQLKRYEHKKYLETINVKYNSITKQFEYEDGSEYIPY